MLALVTCITVLKLLAISSKIQSKIFERVIFYHFLMFEYKIKSHHFYNKYKIKISLLLNLI